MGVDCEIFAENKNKVTQEYLDKINETFDNKWTNPNNKNDIYEIFELDGPTGQFIVFKTMMRYYNKGYERGPWLTITGILNLIRQIGGGKIYYFGDHQDEPNQEFTLEEQAKIDKHFCDVQEHPYRDYQLGGNR